MAGKAFAVVELEGRAVPVAAKFSGGGDDPKVRDVPMATVGGTMRKEPTGGREFEDAEIEFTELEDEGYPLDNLYLEFVAWRDDPNASTRRKSLSIAFYDDAAFTKLRGRRELQRAWVIKVSPFDFDKTSDDPRSFTATISHLGSGYTKASA